MPVKKAVGSSLVAGILESALFAVVAVVAVVVVLVDMQEPSAVIVVALVVALVVVGCPMTSAVAVARFAVGLLAVDAVPVCHHARTPKHCQEYFLSRLGLFLLS